jgi:beta-glucosidase/6-phospho-beta-glucosidase/beta-galactosidase
VNADALPSFWMGGYEGADHVNGAGEALDLVAATGHDRRLDADYRAARRLGLRCVRESIGWRLAERADGSFDLSRAVRMAEAAARQGVHILWTLMHYGVPPDLTLLDDALIPRFARFAAEVARVLAPLCPAPRIYTPINEISFLSWAASATTDMGPAGVQQAAALEDSRISGFQVKQRLVRAALAGMQAIRAADPEARFLHIEPVLHVAPCDADDPEQRALAERIASYQWQTMDMLCGRMDPHLGGHPEALDWVGLNHYHSSQWEVPSEKRLPWHLRDPRRRPLSQLLGEVWRRYERPMLIAETGHIGVGRAAWLHEIAAEAQRARAMGLPLHGVCLYPLLDRPDWNDTRRWHRSGLWHLRRPHERSLNRPYARALLQWRGVAERQPADARPGLLVLLPCAWEDWPAPREQLLDALAATGPLRFLEPPRAGSAEPVLRCHGVAPHADLLVLHGHSRGWAAPPTSAELALLRAALQQAGPHRWACWLAGWRDDGHPAWWRELADTGLILQPDANQPPGGELLRRVRATLPATWPPPTPRPAPPHGYEAEEVVLLLRASTAPRWWLMAPPTPDGTADRLRELAARWPGQHLLVDAPAPPTDTPWPPNLHWLGRVHASLHAALAAAVERVIPWGGMPGWADAERATGQHVAAGHPKRADIVDAAVQAVRQLHLGLPAAPGPDR